MSKFARLIQKKTELQNAYDALTESLGMVRQAWAIENDPTIRLKYEKQAEKLERERADIERELESIESAAITQNLQAEIDRIDFGLLAIAEYTHLIQQQGERIEKLVVALHQLILEKL